MIEPPVEKRSKRRSLVAKRGRGHCAGSLRGPQKLRDVGGVSRCGLIMPKRPWVSSEDQLLRDAVTLLGAPEKTPSVQWPDIAKCVPERTAKQCRERWRHNLDPDVNHGAWTDAESEILLARREQIGAKWAEVASGLPGRTDNSCKNQWNKLQYCAGNGPKRARERAAPAAATAAGAEAAAEAAAAPPSASKRRRAMGDVQVNVTAEAVSLLLKQVAGKHADGATAAPLQTAWT